MCSLPLRLFVQMLVAALRHFLRWKTLQMSPQDICSVFQRRDVLTLPQAFEQIILKLGKLPNPSLKMGENQEQPTERVHSKLTTEQPD